MSSSSELRSLGAENGDRLAVLDGLRAISILLVLAAHLLPLGPKTLQLNVGAAAMGMSLFFALSGFLIASRLIRSPDVMNFLVRRSARILPLFYLYLLFIFVMFDHNSSKLFWSATFLVNYNTIYLGSFNGHLWSLCVEMQFYIAIALTVLALGSRGVWLVWPACLLVTLLRIEAGSYINIVTHLRVDEILAGSCIACLYHKFQKDWLTLPTITLPLAAVIWFLCSLHQMGPLQYARPYSAAFVLVAAIWTKPSQIKTMLASKPARYVAEISYALYIIHPITAYGWMNDGSVATRYLVKRPISFLMTFVLAHISTFYWEKMWTDAAKRWLSQRKSADRAIISP